MTDVLHIDYWDLVSRSIRTAWKHKFLWFFGFFASAGGGNSGSHWGEEGGEWIQDFIYMHPVAFALIVMGAVLLGLALFVMNIICTGGLIKSTSRANSEEPISFSQTWQSGLHTFWRLLGMAVLAVLTVLVVTALCAIPIVLSLLGGAPGIVIGILIGAILFLPYIAFIFLVAFTVLYAEREVVLRDAAVFDALRAGWELTKKHFWKSMVVWLVMLLSGLIFALGIMISLLMLAIPFVIIGIANVFVGLLLGIPVGLAFLFLASGAMTTYSYSVWTLAYEKLVGDGAATAGSSDADVPATMSWEPDPGPTGSDAQGEF